MKQSLITHHSSLITKEAHKTCLNFYELVDLAKTKEQNPAVLGDCTECLEMYEMLLSKPEFNEKAFARSNNKSKSILQFQLFQLFVLQQFNSKFNSIGKGVVLQIQNSVRLASLMKWEGAVLTK